MKNYLGIVAPTAAQFDARGITRTIERALASAGIESHTGPMKGITATIEKALAAAGLMQHQGAPDADLRTIDGVAHEVDETPHPAITGVHGDDDPCQGAKPNAHVSGICAGEFLERSFACAAGMRAYKVYIPTRPSAASSEPIPMVVMLHGCTQSPDDFAAGTRMNQLADEHGFIVVYPAQSTNANGQKCWNWFRTEDQLRDSGEPAIIAGITREVASMHCVDERRIFVAGMSAGAAMAVILGTTYPDLYAGVGAHSGLGYGAAHDVPSAFGAMRGGNDDPVRHAVTIPTIVFHGDDDHTVNARNADAIVEQATARHDRPTLRVDARTGIAKGGRRYRCTKYIDTSDRVVVEHWTLDGAGHAWSGGCPTGSFTDPRGPDASKEMIRFFYSLPRAGTA